MAAMARRNLDDDKSATKHKRDLRRFTSEIICLPYKELPNFWSIDPCAKPNQRIRTQPAGVLGWHVGRCSNVVIRFQESKRTPVIWQNFPIHKEIQIHSTRFSFGKIAATLGRSLWVQWAWYIGPLAGALPRWLSPNLFAVTEHDENHHWWRQ